MSLINTLKGLLGLLPAPLVYRLHFEKLYGIPPILKVSVAHRLQDTRSDYHVYAGGYEPRDYESDTLRNVLAQLMTDDSGVPSVRVGQFDFEVRYSEAVDPESVKHRVLRGIRRTGMLPLEV